MQTQTVLKDMKGFIQGVPQIVPESWCLKCKICCRFPDTKGVQTPTWSPLESRWANQAGGEASWFRPIPPSPSLGPSLHSCGEGYRCPAFDADSNLCTIYAVRPLDCRLYPFVLTRDPGGTRVVLAMDMKCPYLQEHGADPGTIAYAQKLAHYLERPAGVDYLQMNPAIVGPAWPEFVSVAALPGLTATVQSLPKPPHPDLTPLTLSDRAILAEAFARGRHAHSGYTIAGILGWSDLVRYWRSNLYGAFCLFAEQAGGFFMPLPPLGGPEGQGRKDLLNAVWEILDQANKGAQVSRIEGVEMAEVGDYEKAGFTVALGESEYLYRRADLVALQGDRYRSQRWAINRCTRSVSYRFREFQEKDLLPCLQLYTLWGIQRQQESQEPFPKSLVRDSLFFHRRLMISREELGLVGRVLEVDGQVQGYTFGAPISPRLFCVFLEIADRSIPGLAQLLFREFSREMAAYPLLNAMGDCGLAGLRQAKMGYRPIGFIRTVAVSKKSMELAGVEPAAS